MKLPNDHQAIMPYLILERAKAFLDFAKQVFDARETALFPTPDGKIMHAEIVINGSTIMVGNSGGPWKQRTASLFIYEKDVDLRYAQALKQGATSLIEPEDKDYGRTCGVEDPFGNVWWITSFPKA